MDASFFISPPFAHTPYLKVFAVGSSAELLICHCSIGVFTTWKGGYPTVQKPTLAAGDEGKEGEMRTCMGLAGWKGSGFMTAL